MSVPATVPGNRPLEHLKVAELKEELLKKELDHKGLKKGPVEKLEHDMQKEGRLMYFENELDPDTNVRSTGRKLQEDDVRPVYSEEGHDLQKGGNTEYNVDNRRLEQVGNVEMYVGTWKNDIIDTHIQIPKVQGLDCVDTNRQLHELDNGVSGNNVRKGSESSGLQYGLDELPPGTGNIYKPTIAKDCVDTNRQLCELDNGVSGNNVGGGSESSDLQCGLDELPSGTGNIYKPNIAKDCCIQASHATLDKSKSGLPAMIGNYSICRGFTVGTSTISFGSNSTSQQTNDAEMVGFVNSRGLDPKVEEVEGIVEPRTMHLNVEGMVGVVECDLEDVKVKEINMQEWRREGAEVKEFQSQEHGSALPISSKYPFETQILHEPVRSQGVDERTTSPVNVFTPVNIKLEEGCTVGTFEEDLPHFSKNVEGQGLSSQVAAGLSTSCSYMMGPKLLHGPVKSLDDKDERASPVVLAAMVSTKLEEGCAFGMGEKDIPQSVEKFCERDIVCKEGNTIFDGWGEGSRYGFVDEYSGLGYLKSQQGDGYDPKDLSVKVEPRKMDMGDRRKGLFVKAEHQLMEFCEGPKEKLLYVNTEPQAMELIEDMSGDIYSPMEIDSQILMSQRRKEEGKARHQELAKRQRRWNSGNNLIVEAATPVTTGTVSKIVLSDSNVAAASVNPPFKATSKMTANTKPLSTTTKIDQFVNGGSERQRIVPPASRPPTNSLRIDRFLRPFTLKAVKELLSQTGFFSEFWMDQIKTHCYVMYPSVEEAIATRNALYDLQWPPSFGNTLVVDFVDPEEVKVRSEGHLEKSPALHAAGLTLPPAQSVMPSAPVTATRPISPLHHSPLTRENPALVPIKEPEPPILTLDDIFKKTKAKPHIYYLPLTEEEIVAKVAAKKEQQSSGHLIRA